MRLWPLIGITLLFGMLAVSCSGSGQAVEWDFRATSTAEAGSVSPTAIPTRVPSTATAQPTATATLAPLQAENIPVSEQAAPYCSMESDDRITPDSANEVAELGRWGRGQVEQAGEGSNGRFFFVESPLGVYIRGKDSLEIIEHLPNAEVTALSPDRSVLVVAFPDSRVEFWNLLDVKHIGAVEPEIELPAYPPADFEPENYTRPLEIEFSPDGSLVAISYGSGDIGLFSADGPSFTHLLTSNISPFPERIMFTPDGKYLMSAEGERESHAALWEMTNGQLAKNLPGLGRIPERPFHPDATEFVTSSRDGSVLVWSLPEGYILQRFGTGWRWPSVEYSKDGDYYLIHGGSQIRRTEDGKLVDGVDATEIRAPRRGAYYLEDELLFGMGHFPRPFHLHAGGNEGPQAWAASRGTIVRWWPLQERFETYTSAAIRTALRDNRSVDQIVDRQRVKVSPDGTWIGLCTGSNLIVLNTKSNQDYELPPCRNFGFSVDGRTVWIAEDREFLQYSIRNNQLLHKITNHTSAAYLFAPLGDGSTFLTSSQTFYGGNTFIWHRDPFYKLGELRGIHSEIVAVDRAAEGGYLVTADSVVRIWEMASLRRVGTISLLASTVALSRNGELLAVGTEDGKVHLLRLPALEVVTILDSHRGPVTNLDFSEDMKSLYSTGNDGVYRVWGIPKNESLSTADCTGEPIGVRSREIDLLPRLSGTASLDEGPLVIVNPSVSDWYGFEGRSVRLMEPFDMRITLEGNEGEYYLSLFGRLANPGRSWWGEGIRGLYIGRHRNGDLLLRFYDGSNRSGYEDIHLELPKTDGEVSFTLRFLDPNGQVLQVRSSDGNTLMKIDVTTLETVELKDGLFPNRRMFPGVLLGPGASMDIGRLEVQLRRP